MRTVTEFPGVVIRQVLLTRTKLVSGGTAEDQLSAAIGEAHKVEGDRLSHLVKTLQIVGEDASHVARVRVFAGEDETKMPKGSVKEGEHFYLVERIQSAAPPKKASASDRDGKGRGKGRGKGKGKREGSDRERSPKKQFAGKPHSAEKSVKASPAVPGVPPVKPLEKPTQSS